MFPYQTAQIFDSDQTINGLSFSSLHWCLVIFLLKSARLYLPFCLIHNLTYSALTIECFKTTTTQTPLATASLCFRIFNLSENQFGSESTANLAAKRRRRIRSTRRRRRFKNVVRFSAKKWIHLATSCWALSVEVPIMILQRGQWKVGSRRLWFRCC